jgi:predicted transcriptional regulator
MQYIYGAAVVVVLCCAVMPVRVEALEVGRPAPAFEVSYDGSKILRLSDVAGSVVVMTFEARDTTKINQAFKDALLRSFPADERKRLGIALVPVVACFQYFWPIKGVCVRGVQDNVKKVNLQLYVDMSGDVFRDYGAREGTSTVVIVDRDGIVRYKLAGAIPETDVASVVELVGSLARP